MSERDEKIEAFYAKERRWKAELTELRAVLRSTALVEDYKWRGPCYTHGDANVAWVWSLKSGAALGFFKGVLLSDPEGILIAPGHASRSMRKIEFESVAQIRKMKAALRRYLKEAIELEKAGRKVEFVREELPYPEELTARLKRDRKLKAAFEALTPGRRRAYLLHFSDAKQSKTRSARIEKWAPAILAGKGMNDR
ncbi:MAG: YdeI/OmpD-associated family protein [Deltaproteobacteria bacterium]|nr:YdeI/OmpD-associated family protein [Deltaproteobacteria bacterium]